MKTTFLGIFVLFTLTTNATNYYFSTTSGDDNRTSLEAQNLPTPWKSIAKLNSFSLKPGDSVLFKKSGSDH